MDSKPDAAGGKRQRRGPGGAAEVGEEPNSGEREIRGDEATWLDLQGVVYTSVFNPSDGRKNWGDMVTAFCHAFREVEDATLVLKFVHHKDDYFSSTLLSYLYRLTPFKCRVVRMDSFLDDADYLKLIEATTFYVNTSHGEGQCLPLMEFMSCGKPAIAPDNSALRDYIDEEVAFVVNSTLEPIQWQHDSRSVFRAFQGRIDWSSLLAAYEASYKIAKEDPRRYREMAAASVRRMKDHCGQVQVLKKLQTLIASVSERTPPASIEEDIQP